MKATSTAAALLKGSNNLDLMRDQIAKLVKLLNGLLMADGGALLQQMPRKTKIVMNSGRWYVGTSTNLLTLGLYPCFTYSKLSGTDNYTPIYSSDSTDKVDLRTESVQIVWENLPALVDGIIKVLPEIQGPRWKAMLDAAQVIVPA